MPEGSREVRQEREGTQYCVSKLHCGQSGINSAGDLWVMVKKSRCSIPHIANEDLKCV